MCIHLVNTHRNVFVIIILDSMSFLQNHSPFSSIYAFLKQSMGCTTEDLISRTILSQTTVLREQKRKPSWFLHFCIKNKLKRDPCFIKSKLYKSMFYSNLFRAIAVNKEITIVQINCFVQLFFFPLGITLFEIIQLRKCSNST